MLVDLPAGWRMAPRVFGNPQQIGEGMYLNLSEWEIEPFIEDSHPFDPLFTKGGMENRMKAIIDQAEHDLPHDYGVCDHPVQVLERWPQIKEDPRPFIIMFQKVRRADQPSQGGWRWHKWGKYIGSREPQYEYLYDEPYIDEVYIFQIVQLKGPENG